MQATTKDLRLRTNSLLAAVDRGEAVVITYRGKRRAVLVPWKDDAGAAVRDQRNPAFGIWADRDDDVADQVRRARQPRRLP